MERLAATTSPLLSLIVPFLVVPGAACTGTE